MPRVTSYRSKQEASSPWMTISAVVVWAMYRGGPHWETVKGSGECEQREVTPVATAQDVRRALESGALSGWGQFAKGHVEKIEPVAWCDMIVSSVDKPLAYAPYLRIRVRRDDVQRLWPAAEVLSGPVAPPPRGGKEPDARPILESIEAEKPGLSQGKCAEELQARMEGLGKAFHVSKETAVEYVRYYRTGVSARRGGRK